MDELKAKLKRRQAKRRSRKTRRGWEPPAVVSRALWSVPAFVFVAVGGYYAYLGMERVDEAWESYSWPTTMGVVTSKSVSELSGPSGTGKGGTSEGYLAEVSFDYQVSDVSHSSRRISLEDEYFFEFRAEAAIEPYAVGETVTVYYQPEMPERAILVPGLTLGVALPLIGGIAIIMAALGFIYKMAFTDTFFALRRKPKYASDDR